MTPLYTRRCDDSAEAGQSAIARRSWAVSRKMLRARPDRLGFGRRLSQDAQCEILKSRTLAANVITAEGLASDPVVLGKKKAKPDKGTRMVQWAGWVANQRQGGAM